MAVGACVAGETVGADDVGAAEVGADEVGADEVGADEVGADDVGPDDVGADDVPTAGAVVPEADAVDPDGGTETPPPPEHAQRAQRKVSAMMCLIIKLSSPKVPIEEGEVL